MKYRVTLDLSLAIKQTDSIHDWCEKNIGQYAIDWDWGVIVEDVEKGRFKRLEDDFLPTKFINILVFRKEEDAVHFKLRWV